MCVNNPEKHNVSLEDTEQAHFLLAIEERSPQGEYSSAMRQTNCVSNVHLDHTVLTLWDLECRWDQCKYGAHTAYCVVSNKTICL